MAKISKSAEVVEGPMKQPRGAQIREHTRHYAGTSHPSPHHGIREMRGEIVKNSADKAHQLTVKGQKG
jgi:hypothetical protein